MNIRLTQLDGKLPNLALMKLGHWHRARGDECYFTRRVHRDMFEPEYDVVYGSAIFAFSDQRLNKFTKEFPDAIVGGTGTLTTRTIEDVIGETYEKYDYIDYPDYEYSLGFTQRGCRLKCKFCVVPAKEGRPVSVNSVFDIWRGTNHPKKLHLLDNDFFGQPEESWRERLNEIRDGGFKVCLNQGINIRLINDQSAAELATIKYYDDQFKTRRLYTAWDNIGDEKIFFRGVDTLEKHGIPPKHLMVYMLIGFDPKETEDRIFYRFNEMVSRGISPYPMVFDNARLDLKRFQRWVLRGLYRYVPWDEYLGSKNKESVRKALDDGMFQKNADQKDN
jgi:hypothetical protein